MDPWKRLRLLLCLASMVAIAAAALWGARHAPGRPTLIVLTENFKWGARHGTDWERLRCDPFTELRWQLHEYPRTQQLHWGIQIPEYLPEGTHGGFGAMENH